MVFNVFLIVYCILKINGRYRLNNVLGYAPWTMYTLYSRLFSAFIDSNWLYLLKFTNIYFFSVFFFSYFVFNLFLFINITIFFSISLSFSISLFFLKLFFFFECLLGINCTFCHRHLMDLTELCWKTLVKKKFTNECCFQLWFHNIQL